MSNFDFESLTLGEVGLIEDLSGLPISAISAEDAPKGKALAALVLVITRRTDPKYTFNQALGVTLTDATALLGGDDIPEEPAVVEPAEIAPMPGESKRSAKSARG